ncbi:Tfp pilus assembly protein FimT/FimU [Bdellovibrio sp. ZAP7]|uniref:pilus assembly FimT family protein n=1 Tax=Bdellovibrio sp. ZAP7 TaxID=2231053 RepID=UPI001FF0470C|nr:type II secretion system protein [Bdellovibrio sp. ZAP7]
MNRRGFTLIEVMIVLAIIAGLVVIGAPRLFKKQTNIRATTRQFMSLTKTVRNKARIYNSTYRLVLNLDGDNAGTYWVERANGPIPVDPDSAEKERERQKNKSKDDEAPPPKYAIDTSVLKKEAHLPDGFRFTQVETSSAKEPITTGAAYIHFFAEGFVEAAAVQISGGNNLVWTLVFNPLTGQADIIEKAQSLKDIQR